MNKKREKIDGLDNIIMNSLDKRMNLSKEIIKQKKAKGLDKFDMQREEYILNKAKKYSQHIEEIYKKILELSKKQVED